MSDAQTQNGSNTVYDGADCTIYGREVEFSCYVVGIGTDSANLEKNRSYLGVNLVNSEQVGFLIVTTILGIMWLFCEVYTVSKGKSLYCQFEPIVCFL